MLQLYSKILHIGILWINNLLAKTCHLGAQYIRTSFNLCFLSLIIFVLLLYWKCHRCRLHNIELPIQPPSSMELWPDFVSHKNEAIMGIITCVCDNPGRNPTNIKIKMFPIKKVNIFKKLAA